MRIYERICRLKAGGTVVPERGGAKSQPQKRSPFNGPDPLDRSFWLATRLRLVSDTVL